MPIFDGTGPRSMGPGTGRALGPCGAGSGWGWRRGGCNGYGYGRRFFSPKNELAVLEEEEKILEEELEAIREEKTALKDQKE